MTARCAHDRVSCRECGLVPASVVERLEALVDFMEAHAVVRLVHVSATGERVELERHASAFLPPPHEGEPERDRSDDCACGHGLTTEHSETGCFHGCSAELCNTTAEVASA